MRMCWYSTDYSPRGDISHDHTTGTDHRTCAHADGGQYDGPSTDQGALADAGPSQESCAGCDVNVVVDDDVVFDDGSGVDDHPAADTSAGSDVGVFQDLASVAERATDGGRRCDDGGEGETHSVSQRELSRTHRVVANGYREGPGQRSVIKIGDFRNDSDAPA